MLWGGRRGNGNFVAACNRWSAAMPQPNDLSRSLVALDQNSTIIAVVELSQSSWLVGGVVPGIERQPCKKLEPSPERLLAVLHRWRDEAVRAGRTITRIAVAFEAGRDGFWLARWLEARGVEAHVIHPSSVAVSREHRRAKTDRLDTELLKRGFLVAAWRTGPLHHGARASDRRGGRQAAEPGARVPGEVLSRPMRDRRAVARYAGLTGAPDESGANKGSPEPATPGSAAARSNLPGASCCFRSHHGRRAASRSRRPLCRPQSSEAKRQIRSSIDRWTEQNRLHGLQSRRTRARPSFLLSDTQNRVHCLPGRNPRTCSPSFNGTPSIGSPKVWPRSATIL